MSEHSTRLEWCSETPLERLEKAEERRHRIAMMKMMGLMNRIKTLANLVVPGGAEVVVSTCEDGNQQIRDEHGEGGSAFAASIVRRDNDDRFMTETHVSDPGIALEQLLERIEGVAHAHVKRDRDDLDRKKQKLSSVLKAIENKTALP